MAKENFLFCANASWEEDNIKKFRVEVNGYIVSRHHIKQGNKEKWKQYKPFFGAIYFFISFIKIIISTVTNI